MARSPSLNVEKLTGNLSPEAKREIVTHLDDLSGQGIDTYKTLLAALTNSMLSDLTRAQACYLAGLTGQEKFAQALLKILRDRASTELHWEAAKALRLLPGEATIKALIKILRNREELETRKAATYALGAVRNRLAAKALLEILASEKEPVDLRSHAAEMLSFHGYKETVKGLVIALGSRHRPIRFWSAYALGQMGDRTALPALFELKNDQAKVPGSGTVRREVMDAIERIEKRAR